MRNGPDSAAGAHRAASSRRRGVAIGLAAALAGAIALAAGALLRARQEPVASASPLEARAAFEAAFAPEAMRGPDPLSREPVTTAATVALLASAAARLGDREAALRLADRLLALSKKPGPGWGLESPFDAFNDGSANPPGTIYGAETALAAGALLDAFALTGEPKYRDTANAALDHYRAFTVRNAKGLFMAYSDQPADRIPVYATAALLMGEYARAGAVADRADFDALADELFQGLRSEKWDSEIGAAWPYSATNPFWNDAVNAASIGFGIAAYAKHRPKHRPMPAAELDEVKRYLRSFLHDGFVGEFARHAKLKPKLSRPTPVSGVGMLMAALAELGDCEAPRAIAGRLGPYRLPGLRLGYLPSDHAYYPRANAHVVFGLAAVERACASRG
jgi:hypothetical protein